MLMNRSWAARALAAAALSLSMAAQAAWVGQFLTVPGATWTQLWDVNDSGQVVGASDIGSFVYMQGSFTWLQPPTAGAYVTATGINNAGTVFGGYDTHGFVYENGQYTTLDMPGAAYTLVRHASESGRYVTGQSEFTNVPGGYLLQPWVLDRSTGTFTTPTLPGGAMVSVVQGVNDAGLVTGSYLSTTGSGAFVHDLASGSTQLFAQVAGLAAPRFRDINNSGLVVGYAGGQAIVGRPGGSFEVVQVAGAQEVTLAYGINEAGTVLVGYESGLGDPRGFIATQVPEPSSGLLLLAGLAAVGLRRRRAAAA